MEEGWRRRLRDAKEDENTDMLNSRVLTGIRAGDAAMTTLYVDGSTGLVAT